MAEATKQSNATDQVAQEQKGKGKLSNAKQSALWLQLHALGGNPHDPYELDESEKLALRLVQNRGKDQYDAMVKAKDAQGNPVFSPQQKRDFEYLTDCLKERIEADSEQEAIRQSLRDAGSSLQSLSDAGDAHSILTACVALGLVKGKDMQARYDKANAMLADESADDEQKANARKTIDAIDNGKRLSRQPEYRVAGILTGWKPTDAVNVDDPTVKSIIESTATQKLQNDDWVAEVMSWVRDFVGHVATAATSGDRLSGGFPVNRFAMLALGLGQSKTQQVEEARKVTIK